MAWGQSGPRIKSQLERTSHILLSPSTALSVQYALKNKMISAEHAIASLEKINVYDTLIESFPSITFIIYASEAKLDYGSVILNKSEFDLAIERYSHLPNILIIPTSNNDYASAWARDWGPYSTSRTDMYVSLDGEDFLSEHQKIIAGVVSCTSCKDGPQRYLPSIPDGFTENIQIILDEGFRMEGGNFMNTKSGICLTAESTNKGLLSLGCEEVIALPELPGESTGHVDVFAKLINDKTVLVSKYESNDVQIKIKNEEDYFSCNDEQIEENNWDDCEYIMEKSIPVTDRDILTDVKGEAIKKSQDELIRLNKTKFDNFKNPELRDWVSDSNEVKDVLVSKGFDVVELLTPPPVAYVSRRVFIDKNGNKIKEDSIVNYSFPNYTNSLVVNGDVAMPVYDKFSNQSLNNKAIQTYSHYFKRVISIPTDANVTLGGSIHCLTKDFQKE